MENKTSIFKKLNDIQKEVKTMEKKGTNTHGKYNYLSDNQIISNFKKLLEKHKVKFLPTQQELVNVSDSPSGKQKIYTIRQYYMFVDLETGDEFVGSMCGSGSDATDKGIFKATTGAIKYIFIKTFLIPTEDDPENDNTKLPTIEAF